MATPTSRPGIPTLYDWAVGHAALERLTTRFYERVAEDPVIAPVFAHMHGDHPTFVAQFIAEVFGGPTAYSTGRGGHAHMIARHLSRHVTEAQRRRWFDLLLSTADEVGLPRTGPAGVGRMGSPEAGRQRNASTSHLTIAGQSGNPNTNIVPAPVPTTYCLPSTA